MAYIQYTARERVRKVYLNTPEQNDSQVWSNFFDEKNNFTKENVHEIEEMTRGQWTNAAWHHLRDWVITSTKIKQLADGARHEEDNKWNRHYDYTDFVAIARHNDIGPVSRPMQWERDNMDRALDQYWDEFRDKPESHKLLRPGLVMSTENPMIGVSPDAVVKPKDEQDGSPHVLVMVKCPYTHRNKEPKEAASKVMSKRRNGKLYLKFESDLQYQIQYQLGVLKIQECDLVVYTNKGIHVETIEADKRFYGMLKNWVYHCFSHHRYILWDSLLINNTMDLFQKK